MTGNWAKHAMEPWIVSESDEITLRIRKALRRQDVECPLARVISGDAVRHTSIVLADSNASLVLFLAAPSLNAECLDIIRHLHATSDATIVVVSPSIEHATVLQAIRAGAGDFLDADVNLEVELADLVARFHRRRAERTAKARLTAVIPCYSSSDAAALAVNVAAIVSREGQNCGLLDVAVNGGELALHLKLTPRHTIYDLVSQPERLDEAMYQQALATHSSGVQLLAGAPLFTDIRAVESRALQQIVSLSQATHQHVVLVSDDLVHFEKISALVSCDELVLVMRLDLVSLYRAQQHLAYMRQAQTPMDRVHVLALASGHSGELPFQSVKKVLGVSRIDCVPNDPVSNTISVNIGNPLVLELPNSKAAQALVNFSRKLLGIAMATQQGTIRAIGAQLRAATLFLLILGMWSS